MKRKNIFLNILITLAMSGVMMMSGCEFAPKKIDNTSKIEPSGGKEQGAAQSEGGAVLTLGENLGMRLTAEKQAPKATVSDVTAGQEETTYTLTATITPTDINNKTVDWFVEFVDPSSAWASGKKVTDYVTITPTSEGALTAQAVCKKAFGAQIRIRVRSRENPNATAICKLDYTKKVAGFSSIVFIGKDLLDEATTTLTMDSTTLTNGFFGMSSNMDFAVSEIIPTPIYSEYTIDDTFTYRYSIATTGEWISMLGTEYPIVKNSIQTSLVTTAEELFSTSRPYFRLGRYTGLNVVAGKDFVSVLNNTKNIGSLDSYYMNAVNLYQSTYYDRYPILYFFAEAIGEDSNYTTYYGMRFDGASVD